MKKILLTGENGFIGRNVHKILSNKYQINTLGYLTTELNSNVFVGKYDFIIHLGAEAGVRRSHEEPNLFWKHNVEGFQSLIDWYDETHNLVRHNTKVIYASSSSIYEWWLSPYATTKKINEQMTKNRKEFLGLRFHTVYGENSRPDMFYDKLLNGRVSYITNHTRDWTHVNDVVSAIDICIQNFDEIRKEHSAIDVGNGKPVSVKQMVQHLRPDLNLPIKEVTGEREHTCANPKVLLNLGWKPQHHILDK